VCRANFNFLFSKKKVQTGDRRKISLCDANLTLNWSFFPDWTSFLFGPTLRIDLDPRSVFQVRYSDQNECLNSFTISGSGFFLTRLINAQLNYLSIDINLNSEG
jgi:hypothetical protein